MWSSSGFAFLELLIDLLAEIVHAIVELVHALFDLFAYLIQSSTEFFRVCAL